MPTMSPNAGKAWISPSHMPIRRVAVPTRSATMKVCAPLATNSFRSSRFTAVGSAPSARRIRKRLEVRGERSSARAASPSTIPESGDESKPPGVPTRPMTFLVTAAPDVGSRTTRVAPGPTAGRRSHPISPLYPAVTSARPGSFASACHTSRSEPYSGSRASSFSVVDSR